MTNRFDLDVRSVKALEIAARMATGLTVTDTDKQYLSSSEGMAALSVAWNRLSAVRNYHESMGTYR